jgi:hypothetical protein
MTKPSAVFGLDLIEPLTTEPFSYNCTPRAVADYGWLAAPGQDVTGTLPRADRGSRGNGRLRVNWFKLGERELLPASGALRRTPWGDVPTAQFTDSNGRVCDVKQLPDGTLRCVVYDPANGLPEADLSTFPEVTPFTY